MTVAAVLAAAVLVGQYQGPPIATRADGPVTAPRPTVVVLATTGQASLAPPYDATAAALVARGWLAVSLDLPAHGADARPGEDAEHPLRAWASRLAAGEDLVGAFAAQLRAVLDGLAAAGWTDPARVVVVGVSRGGFLAFHAAARDARLASVAAFVPVTDLRALAEFADVAADQRVAALRLPLLLPQLAGRGRDWVETTAADQRVDADLTLAFAAALRATGRPTVLVVSPTVGHVLPGEAVQRDAARWLAGEAPSSPVGVRVGQ